MSALRDIMIERMVGDMTKILTFKNAAKSPDELRIMVMPKVEAAEAEVKALVLNLIEQRANLALTLARGGN